MPPRASASPARVRSSPRLAAKKQAANPEVTQPPTPAAAAHDTSDEAVRHSLRVYLACVALLVLAIAIVLLNAPPAPKNGVCEGVSIRLLIPPSTSGIVTTWRCATAYQASNWWFVAGLFNVTYTGLKMFAIPAATPLCVLSGAIFPHWIAQIFMGLGETLGSTLCFLLSRAIAQPVLERLAPEKLATLRSKLKEEHEHLYMFNIFLRFSPLLPNWFINVASPVVGNPIMPFMFGSAFGTMLSLGMLAYCGSTLRTAGEIGFDFDQIKRTMAVLPFIMMATQFIPLILIRYQKKMKERQQQAAATASKAANGKLA